MLTQDLQRNWTEKTGHKKLVNMLKMYEYDVHLRLMPLGYAGTVYTVTVGNCNLSMLQDLGLQRTVVKSTVDITYACNPYTTSSRKGDT